MNPFLEQYYNNWLGEAEVKSETTLKSRGLRTFVPLCGKSLDLLYLVKRGHCVEGLEGAEKALAEFTQEHGMTRKEVPIELSLPDDLKSEFSLFEFTGEVAEPPSKVTEVPEGSKIDITPGSLRIWKGNLFRLKDVPDFPRYNFWFDRGSFIAIDPATRGEYVALVHKLLAPGAKMLLLSFQYKKEEMQGPPNTLSYEEVVEFFTPGSATSPLPASAKYRVTLIDLVEYKPGVREHRFTKLSWAADPVILIEKLED